MRLPASLIANEQQWTMLFNATPIPTIILKADQPLFTVLFANEAYLLLSDLRADSLVGKSFTVLMRGFYHDMQQIQQPLQQLVHDRTAQKQSGVEYQFITPQGAVTKYFDIYNTPVANDDGEVEFIIRTINDVTELWESQQREKAIHEDLVRHERFLTDSQRVGNVGNWEVDMLKRTVIWSEVLKDIYELPADHELTFEGGLSFYKDEASRKALLEAVDTAIKGSGMFDIELGILTHAGNMRWIRTIGKADVNDGQCTRLYGITQDITASKKIRNVLTESRNQYQALIESVDGVVWEADANTFAFNYISSKIIDILGYTPEQWLSDPNFWADHIYHGDREWAIDFCQRNTKEEMNHVFDYRMVKADGGIVWIKDLVSVISEKGKPTVLRGVMIDVSVSKLLASLDHLEKSMLQLAADSEESIHRIIHLYLKGIEDLLPHMKCSLLQVKNDRLYNMAAPSLPAEYMGAVHGLPISDNAGSCGMSALRNEKVIVADISTHPAWHDHKHLASKFGLRSCWSYPIVNSDNEVVAVLGMYFDDIKSSGDTETLVIERSAAIIKVVLENWQRARIIDENAMLIAQGQELANFGNWHWDINNNKVSWSDVLYTIYGVEKQDHVATFEGYLALLHADDREMVKDTILGALHSKEDVMFEERIIRPDGEIRYLRSWGRVLLDAAGRPEKMIGSCLDITAAKNIELQLWDIAWMQSHLVRAPLVRLMGLIDLLKEELAERGTKNELFDHIMSTAHELDRVIIEISNKTITID
ncbi:PAS domain-containing protein [Mucilaginibacter daejeonensis]|uniref:PAS domain-containing protein n=1 Tax=Mucilaginibacter daejeonensis TaxID=398049 RepID=UPI001D174552|nr:PAS domain-containing protein [Mucilaginibacter daejeonensis]UEG53883.1 PAS domain-containing protein [Mucilaginibacter daejeonensis]